MTVTQITILTWRHHMGSEEDDDGRRVHCFLSWSESVRTKKHGNEELQYEGN
jgi:hypothetical protein